MGRRTRQAALEVLVSFEPARIAAECLVRAYECVLPIRRRLPRVDTQKDTNRHAVGAEGRRAGQRSEHG